MKARTHVTAAATAVVALAAAIPDRAPAHHSTAMYDADNKKTVEGVVKAFYWVNPHTLIYVTVPAANDKPEQVWTIESTSPGRLTRAGWSKSTFKAGDRVKMEIRPLRDGKQGGYFFRAILVDTNIEVTPNGVGPVGTVKQAADGPIPTN